MPGVPEVPEQSVPGAGTSAFCGLATDNQAGKHVFPQVLLQGGGREGRGIRFPMLFGAHAAYAAQTLVVGVPESSPPDYISEDAYTTAGFGIEFMEHIAARAGYAVTYRRYADWESLLEAVAGNSVHVVPLAGITEARKAKVRFTAPVHAVTVRLFVRASSGFESLESLLGHRVGVVPSGVAYPVARALRGLALREAASVEQLLFMLLSGQVDAIIHPQAPIEYFLDQMLVRQRISMLNDRLLDVPYAMAVAPGNDELFARLDEQVRLFAGSREYVAMRSRWYAARDKPSPDIPYALLSFAAFVCAVSLLAWHARPAGKTARTLAVLRTYLSGQRDAVLLMDESGMAMAWNGAAAEVFPVLREARGAQALEHVFDGGDHERRRLALERVAQTGEAVDSVEERNGRLYRITMTPVPALRKRVFIAVLIRDVTDHNAAQMALQDMRTRLTVLFDNAPEGILLLNASMSIVGVNPAFTRFIGHPAPEIMDRGFADFLWPDDAGSLRVALHGVLSGHSDAMRTEHRFRHRSGVAVWASSAVTVQRESGSLTGAVVHVTDIHERKAAELRLRESELRYREIFERASDLILLINVSTGRIEEFNQAVAESLGYTPTELAAMNVADMECPEHCSLMGTGCRDSTDGLFETRLRRKDGREVDVQVHTRMLMAGGRQYTLCVIRDISGIRETRARLEEARLASESALRARNAFFENMSPELRTPLQGIFGMLQLLEETPLDSTQRGYVRMARQTGTSLLRFLDDLLDMAGAEAGGQGERPDRNGLATAGENEEGPGPRHARRPFVLEDEIATVLNALYCEISDKKGLLSASIEPVFPQMMVGDVGRLRQMLFALVGHAVRYARNGRVRLQVRSPREGAVEVAPGLRPVEFAVSLTGADSGAWMRDARLALAGAAEVDDSAQAGHEEQGLSSRQGCVITPHGYGPAQVRRLAVPARGSVYVHDRHGDGEAVGEVVLRLPLRWTPVKDDAALVRTLVAQAVQRMAQSADEMPQSGPGSLMPDREKVPAAGNAGAADRAYDGAYAGGNVRADGAGIRQFSPIPAATGEGVTESTAAATAGQAGNGGRQAADAEAIPSDGSARHSGARVETELANTSVAGLRILLVEDDTINRMVVGNWLEMHGCHVAYAENGRKALTHMRAGVFDCVIMDLQMPEMGGLEASAAIRSGTAGDAASGVPIIALTALALPETREMCASVGMNAFLVKPLDMNRLSETIAAVVPKPVAAEG